MRYQLLFIFVLFLGSALAQDSTLVPGGQEETNILYRNEASGGLVVHSNGFGVTFKRGWHLTGYKKHLLDIELVSMRHPKQYKQANIFYADAKPFFYGKLNFAYFLRGGYGRQNVLYSKGERSGVEVRYNYYVGGTIGITKPVYLDVIDSTRRGFVTEKYNPNDPIQRQPENIIGPGPYFKGFDELKFHPGGYAKLAISFEYAGWQQKVTALEAGVVIDAFPNRIPIMAEVKNNWLYFNFYVSLLWGGKW